MNIVLNTNVIVSGLLAPFSDMVQVSQFRAPIALRASGPNSISQRGRTLAMHGLVLPHPLHDLVQLLLLLG